MTATTQNVSPVLDERDTAILARRTAMLDADTDLRVGDFVRFADGTLRRVSHIWRDEQDRPESVQTSNGGTYYLGDGYVSMSGGLYRGVPASTLSLTAESRDGWVWFFHHDWTRAHNGVDVMVPFRVYECSLAAATS